MSQALVPQAVCGHPQATRTCQPRVTQARMLCAGQHVPSSPSAQFTRTRARKAAISRGSTVVSVASAGGSEAPASVPGSRSTYFPNSYNEIVEDAVRAIQAARADGHQLLEVDFPPLPENLSTYKGASDNFIDANNQLAIKAAITLTKAGLKVQIMVPDGVELERAERQFGWELSAEGVSMGCLSGKSDKNPLAGLGFGSFIGSRKSDPVMQQADVYIATNTTTVELPSLESFVDQKAGGATVVIWNLETETLRGDLGLFGFPPKSIHYRFLSKFMPVLFLRPRAYSKSVNVAPFLVNYSGALFREYPGPWQVMLKQDNGVLACIAEGPSRYPLGEVKEELLTAMGLDTEEEGSALQFLRRGYKTTTWWEEPSDEEQSKAWRT